MPSDLDYRQLLADFDSEAFRELRPAQAAVLDVYSSDFARVADLAVELPTGAGKTLIALLIAEAWRREGHPVAILTANKTLARQMESEGGLLGIEVVRMEGSRNDIAPADRRKYHRALAVGVMNYWVYFNQNPAIDPATLLLMDDAHLAEHCLHSLYSVEIDRFDHPVLFDSLVAELSRRFPDYGVFQDALDPNAPPMASVELFSFLDQDDVVDRLREIVDASPDLEAHADLKFRWRRTRDRLREANLYIAHRSLWLRPAIYPLIDNPHYAQASQRIYFSATVGDTADLARRLGTRQITKVQLADEHTEVTYGRRMLVMNVDESRLITDRLGKVILAALSIHPKSVWLCASQADAAEWKKAVTEWLAEKGFVHRSWLLTSLGSEMDEFKDAPAGHLFVAGRFDGMDFKADECRLVVLATLPRAINLQEQFFSAYLRDAGFMLQRLNQRIIQALGRCNRAEDDFALYVLADPRFAVHFGRESQRAGLPQNILAEIDSAEDATAITDRELVGRVESFLAREFDQFDTDLASHLAAAPANRDDASGDDDSSDEVFGWLELFARQNYLRAADHFAACISDDGSPGELPAFFRWCEAKATFLAGKQDDLAAAERAPHLLERAIGHGRTSSWFNRQKASLNRYYQQTSEATEEPDNFARAVLQIFDDRLERLGTRDNRFETWANRIRASLDSDSHNEYLQGLVEVGELLGYTATRPKHTAATDCRWRAVFGNTREVITFEAKIEHEPSGAINPTAVGQAHNQLARAQQEFADLGYVIRGTIVTHLTALAEAAESSLGPIRVLPKDLVRALFETEVGVLTDYRSRWAVDDVHARQVAAASVSGRFPRAGWLTRALSHDAAFLTSEQLLSEWPRHAS